MSASLPLLLCVATSCLSVSRAQHESALLPEVDPIKDGLLIQKSSLPAFADPSSADDNSAGVVYRDRIVMYDFRPAYPPYKTETLNELMLMPEKFNTIDDDISDDDVPSAFDQESRDPDDQPSEETAASESVDESRSEIVVEVDTSVDPPIDRSEPNSPEVSADDDGSQQHADEEAETPPAEEEPQVDPTSSENGAEIVEESANAESEADEEILMPPAAAEESQDPTKGSGIEPNGQPASAESDASESADPIKADSSSAEHRLSEDEVPSEDLSSNESIVVDVSNGAELEDSTVDDFVPNEKATVPQGAVESSDGDDTATEETQDQAEPEQEIIDDPSGMANETNLDAPETAPKVTLDEGPIIDSDDVLEATLGDKILEARVGGIESANGMSVDDEKSVLDQGLAADMKTQHEYNTGETSEEATVPNDDVLPPSTTTAASSNNNPEANRQFVTGLDEIDKLFESVEAPDELDVGADGSSMQDVIVGQGIKIAWKRARNFGSEVRNRFEKVAESVQKALPQLGMFGGDNEESEETLESLLSKMEISREGGQEAIHEPAKQPERPKPVKPDKKSKEFPLMKSPKAKKIWKFAQRKWHQARHILDDILHIFADDDEEEEDEEIASLLKYGALGGAGDKFGSRVDESFLNEQRKQKQ